MVHDAAGIGRSMIHDAAGIVGSMIHDAAGCGRIADHDAPGGLTPTPAMPGMGRPRGFGTTWHHRGVMRAWWRDAAIIGVRRLFEMIAEERRVDATAIQTVGAKGYDGFAVVRVIG
jgi:hypothetical protein